MLITYLTILTLGRDGLRVRGTCSDILHTLHDILSSCLDPFTCHVAVISSLTTDPTPKHMEWTQAAFRNHHHHHHHHHPLPLLLVRRIEDYSLDSPC